MAALALHFFGDMAWVGVGFEVILHKVSTHGHQMRVDTDIEL